MILRRVERLWSLPEGKALCCGGGKPLCIAVNPPSASLQLGLWEAAAVSPEKH